MESTIFPMFYSLHRTYTKIKHTLILAYKEKGKTIIQPGQAHLVPRVARGLSPLSRRR